MGRGYLPRGTERWPRESRYGLGRVASAVVTTPPDSANLKAWFRASDESVTAAAASITDRSSTGNTLNNVAAGSIEVVANLFGARNGFRFTSADRIRRQTLVAQINQPFTIYCVAQSLTGGVACQLSDNAVAASQADCLLGTNASGLIQMNAGTLLLGSATISAQASALCAIFNGASSHLFCNNFSTPNVSGNAGTNPLLGLALGCTRSGGSSGTKIIADYLLYAGVHTGATRQAVAAYLNSRAYGVTVFF